MDCLRQLRADGLHKGLLPLLDVVLEQPAANTSWNLHWNAPTPACAPARPSAPASCSPRCCGNRSRCAGSSARPGRAHHPGLSQAADSVLDEQTEKLAIQRRFSSDMREIWFMQPRFERRMGKTIYRMIEQPRFRAACDFLQLRAAAGEFDSVLAQWWMDLANADDDLRGEMIEEVSRLPRDPPMPRHRPRPTVAAAVRRCAAARRRSKQ